MKKSLLLFSFLICFLSIQSFSQCSGQPDPACWGTSGPCGSLHTGYAGQSYIDTITFFAPPRVDASVQSGGLYDTLDLVEFEINNVTGLPAGLTWSCGNGSCVYNPQPNGILTNFTICGTPFTTGSYVLTVHTIGTVYVPGIGNQSGSQDFNLTLDITTMIGGNPVFSFTPSQACDSAMVTFTPSMNFPLPQITTYYWDFGGGNVSSVTNANPITINYNTSGDYPVTCTTNVYSLVLTDLWLDVSGQSWWCGDAEELTCGNNNADLHPTFATGMANWQGPEVTDDATAYWGGMNFYLTGTSYSISMFEYDPVSPNDYPPAGPYSGTVTAPGYYTFNNPGNYSGSFVINGILTSQFIATDTVHIYATPPLDTIQATATSFCPYDSVTLSVYPGYFYEWYLNDTTQVQTGSNNTYTTSDAGSYTVRITDPVSGCYIMCGPLVISTLPIVPPGFGNVGITETPPGTYHSILPVGYTYQWLYFDGIQYFPIPAPEGTAADYSPTIDGIYCLIATNSSGCTDTSNCLGFFAGVDPVTTPFMANVYPNPSNGYINVNITNLTEDATLNVYNMIGQQVYSVNVMGNMGPVNEMHDLTFLTKGMYILEVRNNQNRYTQKLIIE